MKEELIMPRKYTLEFKKKIIRLHEQEGCSYVSITVEYGVSKASISKWCSELSKECHTKAETNPDAPKEMELMKEKLHLRKEIDKARKENHFGVEFSERGMRDVFYRLKLSHTRPTYALAKADPVKQE